MIPSTRVTEPERVLLLTLQVSRQVFESMFIHMLRLMISIYSLVVWSDGLLQYTNTISFLSSKAPGYMKHLYKTCLTDGKGGLASASLCVPELPSMSIPKQSGALVSLEHVNINVGSNASSFLFVYDFYIDILRCSADKRAPTVLKKVNKARTKKGKLKQSKGLLWANIGLQQFHLPADDPIQILRGSITMIYSQSEYNNLINRLVEHHYKFRLIKRDSSSSSSSFIPFHDEGIEVMCPYGNTFQIYPTNSTSWFGPAEYIESDDEASKQIQLPGGFTAGLGIHKVDLNVPFGTVQKIAKFYEYYFDVTPMLSYVDTDSSQQRGRCSINIGYNQQLVFTEISEGGALEEYDGHHIAVYINNFVESYYRLNEDELVWNNPRFPQFTYDTVEDALRHNEFRIFHIIDLDTKERIFEIEHELRSLSHPSFACKKWLT